MVSLIEQGSSEDDIARNLVITVSLVSPPGNVTGSDQQVLRESKNIPSRSNTTRFKD